MTEEKDLIAPCGLYCGECFAYLGTIPDLARDLRKELRKARFDKIAESLSGMSFFAAYKEYDKCYDVLGAMVSSAARIPAAATAGIPSATYASAARRKTSKAAGNALISKPARNWSSWRRHTAAPISRT